MKLTSKGREIGEVKLMETEIPGVLPIVIFVITDEQMRQEISDQMKAGKAETGI